MSFDNKKLSSFQFRGLELSCIVSDILFSNTECIGAICDSNFHLTFGLARAIKDAAGDDFLAKLQQERRKQSSSAIAVHVIRTRALQTNYVILCPARRSIRDSFDEIYYEFFNKAKDLQLQSMTLPLLGTGYYGLSFDLATQFLKKAFTQFSNFGSLKKIYFIDQSKKPMDKLRAFFDSQMSSNVNENPSNSLHSGRNKINISALSDSSGSSIFGSSSSSYNTASNDFIDSDVNVSANDESEPSVHHNIRINSSNVTINLYMSEDDYDDDNDSDVNDDMDDDNDVEEDSFISDGDMASLPSSISDSSLSDVSISLNNSDLEDSADGGSDDDSDIADTYPDSSDSEHETNNLQNHLIDEEVFWNSVSVQNLTCSPQKPTTSSNSHQMGVNLDDSTIPCSICLCDMRDNSENAGSSVVQLSLCSHMFHLECIRAAFNVKKQCPLCMCWYKDPIGYQPKDAKMTVRQIPGHVPGHKSAKGFHEIIYHIPAGIQIYGHIRPGRPYRSMTRIAYLPNNKEGTLVLKLLQLAFKRRLIFTIGDSLTTGRKDVPIWNGIHHKTNKGGGPQCYGYPDPDYLSRVKEELAAVGVRIDQLEN